MFIVKKRNDCAFDGNEVTEQILIYTAQLCVYVRSINEQFTKNFLTYAS
jgi:hypothetical protein